MEVIKLEDQELKELKALQEEQNKLVDSFGSVEYQIQSLELQKENFKKNLKETKQKEIELANTLTQKYGDGIISLENGTISKQ